MSWKVRKAKTIKDGKKWEIVKLNTGEIEGRSTTKKKALASIRYREEWEENKKKRKKKSNVKSSK